MFSDNLQSIFSPKFNDEVLQQIVIKKTGWDKTKIKCLRLGEESKKGDSYLSTVVKFEIDAVGSIKRYVHLLFLLCKILLFFFSEEEKQCTVCVIVKGFPKNLARRKTFRSQDFFSNEITFYEKVWPSLDAFQKLKKVNDVFDEIPT